MRVCVWGGGGRETESARNRDRDEKKKKTIRRQKTKKVTHIQNKINRGEGGQEGKEREGGGGETDSQPDRQTYRQTNRDIGKDRDINIVARNGNLHSFGYYAQTHQ